MTIPFRNSFGYTPTCRVKIVDKYTILFVSGNCLVRATFKGDQVSYEPFVTAEHHITAFDYCRWTNILVYAEYKNPAIHLIDVETRKPVFEDVQLRGGSDFCIQSLALSNDGKYLLSLGSLPSYQISLFDIRFTFDAESPSLKKPLICTCFNDNKAKLIAFDPQDSRFFFTLNCKDLVDLNDNVLRRDEPEIADLMSDFDVDNLCSFDTGMHGICIWQTEYGIKDPKFRKLDVLETDFNETIIDAQWSVDHKVLCSSKEKAFLIDALNGNVEQIVNLPEQFKSITVNTLGFAVMDHEKIILPDESMIEFVSNDIPILRFTPEYTGIFIQDGKKVTIYHEETFQVDLGIDSLLLFENSALEIVNQDTLIKCSTFKNAFSKKFIHKFESKITGVCPHPLDENIIAVTTQDGKLYLVLLSDQVSVVSVRDKMDSSVQAIRYSPDGRYLAILSKKFNMNLFDVTNGYKSVFFKKFDLQLHSKIQFDEKMMYLMTQSANDEYSVFHELNISDSGKLEQYNPAVANDSLDPEQSPLQSYRLDVQLDDFVITKPLAIYGCINSKLIKYRKEEDSLEQQELFILRHDKGKCNLHWLGGLFCTHGNDGKVVVYLSNDLSKFVEFKGHDSFTGGLCQLEITHDGILSYGFDKVLKHWSWLESSKIREKYQENRKHSHHSQIEWMSIHLQLQQNNETANTESVQGELNEKDNQLLNEANAKLDELKNRLGNLIENNYKCPDLEKLTKEDFVIDFEERDRMVQQLNEQIQKQTTEIKQENAEKEAKAEEIKRNCWDIMQVPLKHLKSFNEDSVSGQKISVANFALPKSTSSLVEKKIILMRKIGKGLIEKQLERKKLEHTQEPVDLEPINGAPGLLFDDSSLICDQRKRLQMVLISDYIRQLKESFNAKFDQIYRTKQEEMNKIDGLTSRIAEIIKEMPEFSHLSAKVPTFDILEVPEQILEIKPSEIKAEKFISEAEKRRLNKKQQEQSSAQESDQQRREKALIQMMNGTLEEKLKTEVKQEIIRPEAADKPVSERTEEEKRIVKEWEKQVAYQKEEEEKYKKSLESELKKLNAGIQEICAKFDLSLKEFEKIKFKTTLQILKYEIIYTSMLHATMQKQFAENHIVKLNGQLDELRTRKTLYSGDAVELRKSLEKVKEEHEKVLKKEKELEKTFKKQFDQHLPFTQILKQLLKLNVQIKHLSNETNPFLQFEEQVQLKFAKAENDAGVELPEGLTAAEIENFYQLRQKKIQCEVEALVLFNRMEDLQIYLQTSSDYSEKTRSEIERISKEYDDFLEKLFMIDYDTERIMDMKQGQIEFPQQAVVTDYSDAVLIDPDVINKINISIQAVGKKKIEALEEMKTYRKGIHLIEWENKVLDFRAEDLVIKARDIQMLRVTRDIQEYLQNGDEQTQMTKIASLEQQIKFYEITHAQSIREKQEKLQQLQQKLEKLQFDNRKLAKDCSKTPDIQAKLSEQEQSKVQFREKEQVVLAKIIQHRELKDLEMKLIQDIELLKVEKNRLLNQTVPRLPSEPKSGF